MLSTAFLHCYAECFGISNFPIFLSLASLCSHVSLELNFFAEINVCREMSKLLSFVYFFGWLAGWHTSAVSLPPSDVILALLACPQMTSFRVYKGIN
jgi:hypothetical protein